MVHRVDDFEENSINPITNTAYDDSWIVFTLTDCTNNFVFSGSENGCAYTIKVSRFMNTDWKLLVGDFIDYCKADGLNGILAISKKDYDDAMAYYQGHKYNDPFIRESESPILIHSTTMDSWMKIQKDGSLKSWNMLKKEGFIKEDYPIGKLIGDPSNYSDYVMFGGHMSGEIVVSSKQAEKIIMDVTAEYKTGARLYFDAKKIAEDGLLIRDGAHLKVKNQLSLEPYLIWSATWDKIGLSSQISTPQIFAKTSDEIFKSKFKDIVKDYYNI